MRHHALTSIRLALLCLLFFGPGISLYAQFSVRAEQVPLREALSIIERSSGYSFFYNSSLANLNKTVSISAENSGIEKILDSLLEGLDIAYEIKPDRQILLSPAPYKLRKTSQQTFSVHGKVTDMAGNPIIGAGILIEGTNIGTVSDIDGNWSLETGDRIESLTFSSLGFVSRTVELQNRSIIDVALEEESRVLDEVVVVAYGTQKKANLSGAVASVNFSDAGEKRALTNISSGLQGVSSGLLAVQSSGEPGADAASLTIRGLGTLNNSSPLVVIDGIVGSMGDVDPNDVASMSVLKDAASSAIYGSRAANGVILISTKSGKSGKSKVSYTGSAGWQEVSCPIDIVDDYVTYMNTINTAFLNSGNVAPFGDEIIAEWAENSAVHPEIYANTNWFSATFRPALVQNHNIQATGGNEAATYLLSVGYMQNNGTMQKTGYDRYSFRANISAKVTQWLNVTAILNGWHGVQTGVDVSNTMTFLANSSPGTIPQTTDGHFGGEWAPGGNSQAGNIYATLASYDRKNHRTRANGKLTFDIRFADNVHWLSSIAAAGDFSHTMQMNYSGIDLWDLKNNVPLITAGTTSTQLGETYAKRYGLIVDSYIKYDILHMVENHNLAVTAGYNQEYNYYHDTYALGLDVLSRDTDVMNAATTPSKLTGTTTDNSVMSFFGRLNYDWKNRYIFEANFRADGSSRFAKGHRWGYFPSFSAAWRISEEDFMKCAEWLNNLKIRASWGRLGNNSVSDYATQLIYTRKSNVFGDTAVSGAGIAAMVNDRLKWESTTMTDIGIDLSMFRSRLSMTTDVYDKLTEDILVRTNIPGVLGGMAAPYRNAGIVRNRGLEIELGWKDHIGDISYGISGNYSFVRNKVLKYQGDVASYSGQKILLEGYGIWNWYVREVDCIATQEKIDRMLADGYVFYPSTPHPGDFIYKDQQKPGEKGYKVIDDGDRVIKGSPYPEHFFGFSLSFGWKGIDASLLFSGVAGVSQYLNGTWYNNVLKNGSAINKKFLKAWSVDNQDSHIPAITSDDGGRNTVANDFWLQDASYLKLRNATLGYTFPKKWFRDVISRMRIYFTGENLLTFTKFEGLDPETAETQNYPTMKRYMFGLSITF